MDIAQSPYRRRRGVGALAASQRGFAGAGRVPSISRKHRVIHELTQWVLGRAVQDAKAWAEAGDPLVVSVNLSTRCLIDAHLPEKLASTLTSIGLPARLLKLEITESSIIADPIRAQDVINRLHEIGVAEHR